MHYLHFIPTNFYSSQYISISVNTANTSCPLHSGSRVVAGTGCCSTGSNAPLARSASAVQQRGVELESGGVQRPMAGRRRRSEGG